VAGQEDFLAVPKFRVNQRHAIRLSSNNIYNRILSRRASMHLQNPDAAKRRTVCDACSAVATTVERTTDASCGASPGLAG
jgi:hypothetical protein